jgi:hypothetical protein
MIHSFKNVNTGTYGTGSGIGVIAAYHHLLPVPVPYGPGLSTGISLPLNLKALYFGKFCAGAKR